MSGMGRRIGSRTALTVAVVAVAGAQLVTAAAAEGAVTTRVSVSTTGVQADGGSDESAISAHGRYVAFQSNADNLVPGDTNGPLVTDIFVRDRVAGVTRRISVGPNGEQATGISIEPSISGDGRYVAFTSAAPLVAGDTGGLFDAFVRDRATGTTVRVSTGMNGAQPNGAGFGAVISLDGRHVVFNSTASNLVPRDTNGLPDVFVRDLATGVIERVSVGPYGRQGNGDSGGISNPAVSGDGRLAVFTSDASNLVSGDTNNLQDVFLHDRVAKTTRRVSVGPAGIQGNGMSGSFPPAISADGRVVVFESLASTLVASDTNGVADVFVRDLQAGATRRVSVGPGGRQADNGSESVSVSADGRIVTFASYAANLVAGDTNGVRDIFARDRSAGVTLRISVSSAGLQADASSLTPAVSADGRHVAFSSDASNLAGGDTNTATDVFVRDCV